MDTPRRWQVASLATAVASMSIGGLMIARPTSETVAAIDLDRGGESGDLGIASPGEPTKPWPDSETNQIITPVDPVSPAIVPTPGSAASPDGDTDSSPSPRTDAVPPPPPAAESHDSPDASTSVESSASTDSDD